MKKLFLTIVLLFGVIGVFAQAQYIKTVLGISQQIQKSISLIIA